MRVLKVQEPRPEPKATLSRRHFLRSGTAVAAGIAAGGHRFASADAEGTVIMRTIPSTGEELPVIGVGTNAFGSDDPEKQAMLRSVLGSLPELGGKVVDTARSYGSSEEVIGSLVTALGNRERLFIASKTPTRGAVSRSRVMAAFERLQVERLDLLQVHNFNETESLLPVFLELKDQGRVRYIGCSTSSDRQYEKMKSAIRKYPLDFIQVDYSIDNRNAAQEILPMAADNGIAVLSNVPFGGRRNAASTFSRVADVELPEWAGEIDVDSWAQFFLKYVVSHPAVTVSIPGTTKPHHLADNLGAARGRLPDAAMRVEMEQYWESNSK